MRSIKKLGLATAMVAGAIAIMPAVRPEAAAVKASPVCSYYYNFQQVGGGIVCYNPGGRNCVVCQ